MLPQTLQALVGQYSTCLLLHLYSVIYFYVIIVFLSLHLGIPRSIFKASSKLRFYEKLLAFNLLVFYVFHCLIYILLILLNVCNLYLEGLTINPPFELIYRIPPLFNYLFIFITMAAVYPLAAKKQLSFLYLDCSDDC